MASAAKDFDREELLDCVLVHRAERIREFLAQVSLPRSGTKDILRERLAEFLETDSERAVQLVEFLNEIEGWGNQHLYLYKSSAALCSRWRSEAHVTSVLKRNRTLGLLNQPRPVVLPEKRTVSEIRWSPARLRIIWNERREWFVRDEEADKEADDGETVFRAWKRNIARATLAFDWDLATGDAMIMIQRLPSGTNYPEIRDELLEALTPFVAVRDFDITRVSVAIQPLQLNRAEVRERRINWETVRGGKASFTSAGKRYAVNADETLRRMADAGKNDVQGSLGNFYWLAGKGRTLKEEAHTILHRKDQRVALAGEKRESEVRHVVGRIRAHCN